MEANKTPEKIYISVIPSEFAGNKTITCGKDFPNAVEYTRTDAFIEKACEWLMAHSEDDYFELIKDYNYCGAGTLNKKRMVDDFKNYMKELV